MDKPWSILVLNVGSTSTKLAWFKGSKLAVLETVPYAREDPALPSSIPAQLPHREKDVLDFLKRHGINPKEIDVFVSRGGLGRPAPAGVYGVDDAMCRDLIEGKYGMHPSCLGSVIALNFSRRYGAQAIVVDPPSTDEFHPLARISGLPEIERKSVFHCLNQKTAARHLAAELGVKYQEINIVVAHLGGGITIGAHEKGRVIDCTHGLAEGPFTPERAGALPTCDLVNLVFSGTLDREQLQSRLVGKGGLCAYLGTTDVRKVEEMVRDGDERAKLILEAMIYQIAKDIGTMCVVLKGAVDGIILTGGMAHSEMLADGIKKWVSFLAPVFVFAGEDEMTALAEGALRVLLKEEEIKKYWNSALHHDGMRGRKSPRLSPQVHV
jgi:butyrate kinase